MRSGSRRDAISRCTEGRDASSAADPRKGQGWRRGECSRCGKGAQRETVRDARRICFPVEPVASSPAGRRGVAMRSDENRDAL
jgi:hypothetical protein